MTPIFDPVINFGAVLSLLGSAIWVLGLWFGLVYKVKRLQERNEEAYTKASDYRDEVRGRLVTSEKVLNERLGKIESKLDIHGTTLSRIAVQDERMKAFDLRLADINDQIKNLVMATRWPRPNRNP